MPQVEGRLLRYYSPALCLIVEMECMFIAMSVDIFTQSCNTSTSKPVVELHLWLRLGVLSNVYIYNLVVNFHHSLFLPTK